MEKGKSKKEQKIKKWMDKEKKGGKGVPRPQRRAQKQKLICTG